MCPVCNEPMVVFELESAQIDRCDRCGGTWLDAAEIRWIVGKNRTVDRLVEAVRSGPSQAATRRRCPRCFRRLREISVPSGPDVVLDQCPRGHGLWCDRGELILLMRFVDASRDPTLQFLSKLFENQIDADQGGTEWVH